MASVEHFSTVLLSEQCFDPYSLHQSSGQFKTSLFALNGPLDGSTRYSIPPIQQSTTRTAAACATVWMLTLFLLPVVRYVRRAGYRLRWSVMSPVPQE